MRFFRRTPELLEQQRDRIDQPRGPAPPPGPATGPSSTVPLESWQHTFETRTGSDGETVRRVDGAAVGPEEFERMLEQMRGRIPDDMLAQIERTRPDGQSPVASFSEFRVNVARGGRTSVSGSPGRFIWRALRFLITGR